MTAPIITRLRYRRPVLADTQATHTTILTGLAATNGCRVLWAAPTRDLLVVQASTPLDRDMRHVIDRTHAPVRTQWEHGTPVRLSLIACPVRTNHRRRTPLPLGDCEAWLRRKLAGAVALDAVAVEEMGRRHGRRHDSLVTHRLVGFAAAGRVLDPDALAHAQIHGVGPGKAYGAGLLLAVAA